MFSQGEMIIEATDVVDDDASLMDHDQDTETENLAENDMEQDDHDDLESDEGEGAANGMGFVGMENEIFDGVVPFPNNHQQEYF